MQITLLGNKCCTFLLSDLSEDLFIFGFLLFTGGITLLFDSNTSSLASKSRRCNQSLNFWGFYIVLLSVASDFALGHEKTDIIILGQTPKFPDLSSSFRATHAGFVGVRVGESRKVSRTLLDDNKVQTGEIRTYNATTDRFTFAATRTLRRVHSTTSIKK